MSDRERVDPPDSLAGALRALPQSVPLPDLWPDLAQSLAARRRKPWRRALAAALAAAVALAVLVPRPSTHDADSAAAFTGGAATATPDATPAADELATLHRRSQALERWIAGATQAPLDGRDLMAAVEIEDMIGLIDVQLGATRGDADALPLWRQRVGLLEDLAAIRVNASYALAAN